MLREVVVKHLALKVRWMARRIEAAGATPVIFVDEPFLTSFGTPFFAWTRPEQPRDVLEEVYAAAPVKGTHCCANTDWTIFLKSSVDIVAFDAFGYAQGFLTYRDELVEFLGRGGNIAWGIVPTDPDDLAATNADDLLARLDTGIERSSSAMAWTARDHPASEPDHARRVASATRPARDGAAQSHLVQGHQRGPERRNRLIRQSAEGTTVPHTVNGIGTWYYGKKNLTTRRGTCQFCGREAQISDYETRLWFVVIFLPIIPLGRKQILDDCSSCRRHRAVPVGEWERATQDAVHEAGEAAAKAPNDPRRGHRASRHARRIPQARRGAEARRRHGHAVCRQCQGCSSTWGGLARARGPRARGRCVLRPCL